MNVATWLSVSRLIVIPFIVLFYYLPFDWARAVAAIIFAIGAITDWFDGYIARKFHLSSPFGRFIDPVADKLIVAVALIIIAVEFANLGITLPVAIILCREIIISGLREWMAELGKRMSVAVNSIAKFKTTLQMMAITILLAYRPGDTSIAIVGIFILYVAVILTLWSMLIYLKTAWPDLTMEIESS